MKNLFQYFIVVIALATFVACSNDDDTSIAKVGNYARFADAGTLEVSEAEAQPLNFPLYLNYRSASDVKISYTLEGDSNSYKDLSETPGEVVIPAGERTATISIAAVDNTDYNPENASVTITLASVTGDYALTTEEIYLSRTVVFLDNDCPPNDRDAFVGELQAEDVGYGLIDGVSATLSGDNCNVLFISGNLPNSNAALSPTYAFVLTQGASAGEGTVSVAKQPYGENFYEASGIYKNGVITVDYKYTKPDGSSIWGGTNVIQKP